jgi:HD-GYP domain-containing protein (c-di-GMP phosphodiesterase class II)
MLDVLGLCFGDPVGARFVQDPWTVVLSYGVAAIGSFAALDMTERLNRARGWMGGVWLVGSATVLGGSIWSMHFIGILAAHTLVPIGFDLRLTVLSFLLAVAACGVGLQIVRGPARPMPWQFAGAGLVVGIGVAAMHYMGMAALELPGTLSYTPVLFCASVAIAIGAAAAAFWLSWALDQIWQRAVAALVMGGAICGMHYVGMAATVIHFNPLIPASIGLDRAPLTIAVAGTTIALLMLVLVCDGAHRRLGAASRRETETLLTANREIVRRLCAAGELRDGETSRHVLRLSLVAERLAAQLGCEAGFAKRIGETAQLHDIGKIGIPDSVLLKPGPLTPAEWQVMRSHAEMGYRILGGSGIPLLDLAAEIALTHHEKWDGTGYPQGLKGEQIPLAGRIVAVADVFDALLSDRPYKEPWPLAEVEAHLRRQSGRHFDPRIVAAFLDDFAVMVAIQADNTSETPSFADRPREPLPELGGIDSRPVVARSRRPASTAAAGARRGVGTFEFSKPDSFVS